MDNRDRGADHTIAIEASVARVLVAAIDGIEDGASMHPGWGPRAQETLTSAMNRLREAVLEDSRRMLAAYNAAELERRRAQREAL